MYMCMCYLSENINLRDIAKEIDSMFEQSKSMLLNSTKLETQEGIISCI